VNNNQLNEMSGGFERTSTYERNDTKDANSRDTETTTPLFVSHLKLAEHANQQDEENQSDMTNFKVSGVTIRTFSIVGRIVKYSKMASNFKLFIDDSTGEIEFIMSVATSDDIPVDLQGIDLR